MTRNGLLQYLPQSMKALLLERSIFDVLCDLWFFPRISLVAKAVVWPFFSKPRAEEAIKTLDILPEDIKEVFVTKGVINLFPKKLSKVMLPNEEYSRYKIFQIMQGNLDARSLSGSAPNSRQAAPQERVFPQHPGFS